MICRDLENSEAQLILTAVRNDVVIMSQHEVCEFHTHTHTPVFPSPCLTNTPPHTQGDSTGTCGNASGNPGHTCTDR